MSAPLAHIGARLAEESQLARRARPFRGPSGEWWPGGPGRKPEWVRAVLAKGESLDAYRI